MSYQIAVFLHLLAAFTWIGGTLFLIMVLVPLTRQGDGPPGATAQLLEQAARKFRPVAWSAILVLVVSGLFIATDHFDTSVKEFFEADTRFVKVLQMKVGMVIIVVALSAVHDFVLGPSLVSQNGGPARDWRASCTSLGPRPQSSGRAGQSQSAAHPRDRGNGRHANARVAGVILNLAPI